MMMAKVFCVGFHKTGTKTIAAALQQLGYRVMGPLGTTNRDIGRVALELAEEIVGRYDAFQDNPWPILYRELDQRYPGSRFILTLRDPRDWIRSQVAYFGEKESPMRAWIYGFGSPVGHEDTYLQRFTDHNREVLAYFADRPDDLLAMDFSRGDGWEALCRFLGREAPDEAFPHMNRTQPA